MRFNCTGSPANVSSGEDYAYCEQLFNEFNPAETMRFMSLYLVIRAIYLSIEVVNSLWIYVWWFWVCDYQ